MTEPLVSIIVPVYNVEKYLNRCVQSICNQTYTNLEILLIDDGSTDKSGQICDELRNSDERIVVFHKTNGGISSARNKGLDLMRGQYVGFVDSDDWIEPQMVEILLLSMKKHNSQIAVGEMSRDSVYRFEENCSENVQTTYMDLNEAAVFICSNGYACNKLFATSLFCSSNLVRFDEQIKYVEDQPTILELVINSNGMVKCNAVVYHYYENPQSITRRSFNLSRLTSLKGFKRMLILASSCTPELKDYFESRYIAICVGFYRHKEVRKSPKYREMVKKELKKDILHTLKLRNLKLKFKVAALVYCFL